MNTLLIDIETLTQSEIMVFINRCKRFLPRGFEAEVVSFSLEEIKKNESKINKCYKEAKALHHEAI